MGLFQEELAVINVGVENFYEALKIQNVKGINVQWTPPQQDVSLLEILESDQIDAANQEAYRRINMAEPMLCDVKYAHEVFPEFTKNTIGHAGPPLSWAQMCGPLKSAILGAIVYEGLCDTTGQAEMLVEEGAVKLVSNHSLGAVGPMTGMITYSMPLCEVENTAFGNVAYSTFNEGLGKVLRFGANGPEVIARLKWIERTLAPAFKKALSLSGPIALKVIMAKALTMGDEMHQRNIAASCLLARMMTPWLAKAVENGEELYQITDFIAGNEQFFLNFAMAAGKATMDPVKHIPHCSVVTAMSRNGTNFGIKVSGLGEQWFEAPVQMPQGLYFPGYSMEDANPDIGDSAICETIGIGGVAMGAAPAVVRFVGAGSVSEAMEYSRSMQEIAVGVSPHYLMPAMDFAGTATGLDIRKVVATGILPVINTGIAHKMPGVGQIGAGIVFPPIGCFLKAAEMLANQEKG